MVSRDMPAGPGFYSYQAAGYMNKCKGLNPGSVRALQHRQLRIPFLCVWRLTRPQRRSVLAGAFGTVAGSDRPGWAEAGVSWWPTLFYVYRPSQGAPELLDLPNIMLNLWGVELGFLAEEYG